MRCRLGVDVVGPKAQVALGFSRGVMAMGLLAAQEFLDA